MKYLNHLLLKYFLHNLPPELAHSITLKLINKGLVFNNSLNNYKNLNVKLGNINFQHPIGLAAGFDKDGEVFHQIDKLGLSHTEIGTITPKLQTGNSKPRVFRLSKDNAIINRLGFPSKGLEYVKKRLENFNSNVPLGINIGCNKETTNQINDYIKLTKSLGTFADWITINISSPNTPGLRNIQTSALLPKLLNNINNERKIIEDHKGKSLQIWLKISPDLNDTELKNIIDTSLEYNIDAICISNTTIDRSLKLKSMHKNENGGLSGTPLNSQSTKILAKAYLHAKNNIRFIGIGGITNADDAYMKMLAGASILQLYTGLVFNGPNLIKEIVEELNIKNKKINITSIIGSKAHEISKGYYPNE
ncbi:MAG: dihydroorotate dehydrogenase (quinone) [Pelagibacterales bacterium]|nr:dihydroorotate dehydrogenase (quinone) [Pelagibacterales bacterium]PPR17264.1 MAG: Dihydroorotate dehydrogenase (quinone) [Alphaproteobacteria bacterium MarineAlpha9_Bin3]|tara:strand:+ start:8842 stop:9930 length:1089 start_codon:yes stop_codon:yes gene_type:complete